MAFFYLRALHEQFLKMSIVKIKNRIKKRLVDDTISNRQFITQNKLLSIGNSKNDRNIEKKLEHQSN